MWAVKTAICFLWKAKKKRKLEHFKGLVLGQAYIPLVTPACYMEKGGCSEAEQ